MITTLTSITTFMVDTIGCMCIIVLAMCTYRAIKGVFIPCYKNGTAFFGLILTIAAIARTFVSSLKVVFVAVGATIWFTLYGAFVIVRDLVTSKSNA